MIKVFLVICLLFTHTVIADSNVIEKQTLGFGKTYQDAMSNALLTAVRQVRGLEIGTEQNLKAEFNQVVDKTGISHSSASLKTVTDVYDISKGWIKSFTVVNVTEPKNDGMWKVKLNVLVPSFESKFAKDNKIRIAVMPFRINSKDFKIKDTNASGTQIAKRLAENISGKISQSKKLTVLNRSYGHEFSAEKDLLSSDNVLPEEASRIGQMIGADLIVVGNIYEFITDIETQDFYGAENHKLSDRIDVYFSSIEPATGKVIGAKTKTYEHIRAKDENNISQLMNSIGLLISNDILSDIFPDESFEVKSTTQAPKAENRPMTPGSSEKPFKW